jgi:hypothetical protein
VRASIWSWLALLLLIAACERSEWKPTPLVDGYQIMVMSSEEVYVANAANDLILGPEIETIGIAPGVIVVNCGPKKIVADGLENTAGFNLLDTRTGVIWKGLTAAEAEQKLRSRNVTMPEMRPLSSYLP